MNTQEERDYREWLGERIEGFTGALEGEGRGLWSLNTSSLEKLYTYVVRADPKAEWRRELRKRLNP
jgi:hypothetical protein